MANETPSCEEIAEEIRKKHHYRQLILSGRLKLPYQSAARLLGPDCLYHLYSKREAESTTAEKSRAGKRKRPGVKHKNGR